MAKRTPRSDLNDATAPAAGESKRRNRARGISPADSAPDAVALAALAPDEARAIGGPTEDDIRQRAYQRYLERGGGHGLDFEDWLEAERELRARHSR